MDKMQFFIPSLRKAILFALIFLFLVPFMEYDNGIRCIRAPCPASDVGSVFAYVLLHPSNHIYRIIPENLIAGLLLAYVAACAADYFWNGRKRR